MNKFVFVSKENKFFFIFSFKETKIIHPSWHRLNKMFVKHFVVHFRVTVKIFRGHDESG